MSFIKLGGIYKSFPVCKKTIAVLRNINFSVKENEFVVLLGPSGSGKTTLLNIIAGLDRPNYGEIEIGGEKISKLSDDELSEWRAKNVGIIFQAYNLMPYMTALDNVALPMVFQGMDKEKRLAKANSLLKIVNFKNYSHYDTDFLSIGEQKRIALARSMINDPKILIVDEPTGDLDSYSAEEIIEILYTLYKEHKTTIIMATHNKNYTKFADRVIRLVNGRIVDK